MLFEVAVRTVSPNTRKAYAQDVAAFSRWAEEVRGVSAQDGLQWLVGFEKPGQARMAVLEYQAGLIEQGLSKATVARRIRSLNAIVKKLRFAEQVNWDLKVPVDKIEALKDVRGPGMEKWKKLIATTQQDRRWFGIRDLVMLYVMGRDNLRAGEVSKLRMQDMRLGEGGRVEIFVRGKGSKDVWHPISPRTREALTDWIDVRDARLKEQDQRSSWLFFSRREQVMTGPRVWERVMKRAAEAGIGDLHPHALRHHAITQKAKRWKGSQAMLARWARHADANMTQRYIDESKDEVYAISQLEDDDDG